MSITSSVADRLHRLGVNTALSALRVVYDVDESSFLSMSTAVEGTRYEWRIASRNSEVVFMVNGDDTALCKTFCVTSKDKHLGLWLQCHHLMDITIELRVDGTLRARNSLDPVKLALCEREPPQRIALQCSCLLVSMLIPNSDVRLSTQSWLSYFASYLRKPSSGNVVDNTTIPFAGNLKTITLSGNEKKYENRVEKKSLLGFVTKYQVVHNFTVPDDITYGYTGDEESTMTTRNSISIRYPSWLSTATTARACTFEEARAICAAQTVLRILTIACTRPSLWPHLMPPLCLKWGGLLNDALLTWIRTNYMMSLISSSREIAEGPTTLQKVLQNFSPISTSLWAYFHADNMTNAPAQLTTILKPVNSTLASLMSDTEKLYNNEVTTGSERDSLKSTMREQHDMAALWTVSHCTALCSPMYYAKYNEATEKLGELLYKLEDSTKTVTEISKVIEDSTNDRLRTLSESRERAKEAHLQSVTTSAEACLVQLSEIAAMAAQLSNVVQQLWTSVHGKATSDANVIDRATLTKITEQLRLFGNLHTKCRTIPQYTGTTQDHIEAIASLNGAFANSIVCIANLKLESTVELLRAVLKRQLTGLKCPDSHPVWIPHGTFEVGNKAATAAMNAGTFLGLGAWAEAKIHASDTSKLVGTCVAAFPWQIKQRRTAIRYSKDDVALCNATTDAPYIQEHTGQEYHDTKIKAQPCVPFDATTLQSLMDTIKFPVLNTTFIFDESDDGADATNTEVIAALQATRISETSTAFTSPFGQELSDTSSIYSDDSTRSSDRDAHAQSLVTAARITIRNSGIRGPISAKEAAKILYTAAANMSNGAEVLPFLKGSSRAARLRMLAHDTVVMERMTQLRQRKTNTDCVVLYAFYATVVAEASGAINSSLNKGNLNQVTVYYTNKSDESLDMEMKVDPRSNVLERTQTGTSRGEKAVFKKFINLDTKEKRRLAREEIMLAVVAEQIAVGPRLLFIAVVDDDTTTFSNNAHEGITYWFLQCRGISRNVCNNTEYAAESESAAKISYRDPKTLELVYREVFVLVYSMLTIGLIHGDEKCGNIVVSSKDPGIRLALIDFGPDFIQCVNFNAAPELLVARVAASAACFVLPSMRPSECARASEIVPLYAFTAEYNTRSYVHGDSVAAMHEKLERATPTQLPTILFAHMGAFFPLTIILDKKYYNPMLYSKHAPSQSAGDIMITTRSAQVFAEPYAYYMVNADREYAAAFETAAMDYWCS